MKALRFKHVYGEVIREKYEQVTPTTITCESTMVKGNPLYTAFIWQSGGGGVICILENNKQRKVAMDQPMLKGHQATILDLDWYPFDDHYLATSSMDNSIKIWSVPEEFHADITQENTTLYGHEKKVCLIQWNPTAAFVLASGGYDSTVRIWDVQKGEAALVTQSTAQAPLSVEWNHNGSLIGTSWNDKKYRIIDPRQSSFVAEIDAHQGTKPQKFGWLGDTGYHITVGFNKSYEREYMYWDIKKPDTPLVTKQLDSGSGVLYPYFDNDLKMLYITGKGDTGIKFFEYMDGQLHFLNSFGSTVPGKGYSWFPKRALDVTKCEIMKCIKIEEKQIEYVSFIAPRKSPAFQEDLFPDCTSIEPALTTDQWFSGQTANPKTQSMRPEHMPTQKQTTQVQFQQKEKPKPKQGQTAEEENVQLKQYITSLEDELKAKDEKIATLENIINTLQQQK